jgi:signal transduction histidine kinase
MTFRIKLLISTLLEVMLVVLVSVFLVVSSQQISRASDNETRATNIVDTVSQIRFVTFEHLLHHDERSFEQWQAKHNSLSSLLTPVASQSQAEHEILNNILSLSHDVGVIFGRLVASYAEPATSQNTSVQKEFQERLANQLLIKQQTQISEALKLASLGHAEAASLRDQANWLVAVVIACMLVITVVNFFFLTRTVTKALGEFQKGADAIASGKYSYRITPRKPTDEFGRVATAFNSMAANLEQIDKVKSEFILLASHQLRTPLTAVKWYSKVLATSSETMPQERRKRYTNQVYESNERMIELVNKLLDASKIGVGGLSPVPEPVQVTTVLGQALRDVSAQIRDNRIEIIQKIDERSLIVTIDPAWLRIIFQNLLSNAIRYSRPGQSVTIMLKRKDAEVSIAVADQGYGIPVEQQDKIFTKLFRADNAKKAMGEGSGLGLYIAKAMVEQAGGKIWFDSVENKGTTFHVALPVSPEKREQ